MTRFSKFVGSAGLSAALVFLLSAGAAQAAAPTGACFGGSDSSQCQFEVISNSTAPLPTISHGIRFNSGVSNVLFNSYPTLCRFIDNGGSYDLFVPQATSPEFQAFLTGAVVTIANCVPPLTYAAQPYFSYSNFTIYDAGGPAVSTSGSQPNQNVTVPSDGSIYRVTSPAKTTSVSVSFTYTRSDCNSYGCQSSSVREVDSITLSGLPSSPAGNDGHWGNPTVARTWFVNGSAASGPYDGFNPPAPPPPPPPPPVVTPPAPPAPPSSPPSAGPMVTSFYVNNGSFPDNGSPSMAAFGFTTANATRTEGYLLANSGYCPRHVLVGAGWSPVPWAGPTSLNSTWDASSGAGCSFTYELRACDSNSCSSWWDVTATNGCPDSGWPGWSQPGTDEYVLVSETSCTKFYPPPSPTINNFYVGSGVAYPGASVNFGFSTSNATYTTGTACCSCAPGYGAGNTRCPSTSGLGWAGPTSYSGSFSPAAANDGSCSCTYNLTACNGSGKCTSSSVSASWPLP